MTSVLRFHVPMGPGMPNRSEGVQTKVCGAQRSPGAKRSGRCTQRAAPAVTARRLLRAYSRETILAGAKKIILRPHGCDGLLVRDARHQFNVPHAVGKDEAQLAMLYFFIMLHRLPERVGIGSSKIRRQF